MEGHLLKAGDKKYAVKPLALSWGKCKQKIEPERDPGSALLAGGWEKSSNLNGQKGGSEERHGGKLDSVKGNPPKSRLGQRPPKLRFWETWNGEHSDNSLGHSVLQCLCWGGPGVGDK